MRDGTGQQKRKGVGYLPADTSLSTPAIEGPDQSLTFQIMRTFILFVAIFLSSQCIAQADSTGILPAVEIIDLNRKKINAGDIKNEQKPVLVVFWATWCTHTITGLNEIADLYEDWKSETGVKVVAIATDNSRSSQKVKGVIEANEWEYEFYMDENADLIRAVGAQQAPYLIIYDGKGKRVWEKSTYLAGDDEVIYEKLIALTDQ